MNSMCFRILSLRLVAISTSLRTELPWDDLASFIHKHSARDMKACISLANWLIPFSDNIREGSDLTSGRLGFCQREGWLAGQNLMLECELVALE